LLFTDSTHYAGIAKIVNNNTRVLLGFKKIIIIIIIITIKTDD